MPGKTATKLPSAVQNVVSPAAIHMPGRPPGMR